MKSPMNIAMVCSQHVNCLTFLFKRCLGKTFGSIFPSLEVIGALDPAKTCRDPDKVAL